jgi:hypothetical protein
MVRVVAAQHGLPRSAVAFALALALGAGGCGSDDELAGGRRPPAAITVSAVITPTRVSLSPARFGAGAIELVASNQTATSQRLQLRSGRLAAGGRPLVQRTGPINPGGTASLTADVDEGTYVVSARSPAIAPATIAVGAPRASAAHRLLQP